MEETLKISLSLLAILCALSSAGVSSPREAAALVFDDLLALDITGRTVSYLPEAVYQGQGIEAWHETVVSPFSGYLVLVDDMALANWEHPCRWVFVAFDGTTSIVEMHTPPLWLERMEVYRTSLPAVSSIDNRQALLDWFVPNPQTPENDPEHTYAWIISGGANQGSNHIRYYGDVQFLYLTLTQDYGYTNDHIVICFADGTNPAVDNSSGGNSNPDLDGDGTVDFDFDASYDGIWNGYNQILSLVGSDDHLFIFTTDHGGSGKGLTNLPPEAYLNLWNSQQWNDDAYDTWIDAFNTISLNVAMEQCYSGGFLAETVPTTGSQHRTFTSAANGSESSWAGATMPDYDEWAYWWIGAMHGWLPAGGSYPGGALPGNPDLNDDGFISYGEAANRAKAWDSCAQSGQEHPQYDDDPDSCGDLYYLGGRIYTGIADETSEAPLSSGLSCSANPFTGAAVVSFELSVPMEITLEVLDIAGRRVATLAAGELAAGRHEITWNAEVPTGVYLVRMDSPSTIETLRLVKF